MATGGCTIHYRGLVRVKRWVGFPSRFDSCLTFYLFIGKSQVEHKELNMDVKFDFEHLSFLSNVQTEQQYTKLGFGELYQAAAMSGSDHSKFFDAFGKLITTLETVSDQIMDLDDLLSLKSDNGCPNAVYGGAIQIHPELGLCLSFGVNHFAVTQKGKELSIGSFVGELKIQENKREDQTVYYSLFWEAPINEDYDVFFAIPIAKDPNDPEGKRPLNINKDVFKKDILANNNLASYVRAQSEGGKFENYGNCPRIEGAGDPIKPAKLEDGVYILTGIAHGVLVKKEDGKEFDSVIGYLQDGRRVSINSYAKSDFIADPKSFRFPLQWIVTHLDANRTRSVLRNISAPVESKTALPSRFAAYANKALPVAANVPIPAKSALVGDSSADFEKPVESQTPIKSAAPSGNDDFF